MNLPVLEVVTDGVIVTEVLLDGKPLPWPTVGEYVLRITPDGLAVLTVEIPVEVRRP